VRAQLDGFVVKHQPAANLHDGDIPDVPLRNRNRHGNSDDYTRARMTPPTSVVTSAQQLS
jgi:hypothetical protein